MLRGILGHCSLGRPFERRAVRCRTDIAFLSNEATINKTDVYVRPFDPNKPESPAGPAVQVSKKGAIGMISWRQDGKEMYFLTRDWEVMAVDVTTTPSFQAGTPRMLFKAAERCGDHRADGTFH